YVQYNLCRNDPALAFSAFSQNLFAFADAHAVDRVVIDLRFNPGGDSSVVNPLLNGLRARSALRGHVVVLIGAGTASSAQDAAIALRNLGARLIGEPTRQTPNGYGEVRPLTLPNSAITIQYSTKYFRMIANDHSSALEPDLQVPAALSDLLAGRDAALDAALHASTSD